MQENIDFAAETLAARSPRRSFRPASSISSAACGRPRKWLHTRRAPVRIWSVGPGKFHLLEMRNSVLKVEEPLPQQLDGAKVGSRCAGNNSRQ